jgi:translation initiation factor IF-3
LKREEALAQAQERGLDLVEITARSNPPVCRIMDYGRFKYEQSKKQKQAKKHSTATEIKEIRFRPKTAEHDLDFKVKHIRRFLEEGNKCRLVVVFRGREVVHPETGIAMLNKVFELVTDMANIELKPSMEGKRMIMILGPKRGVARAASKSEADSRPAEQRPPRTGTQDR